MKESVDTFFEQVYAPFIIHFAFDRELAKLAAGKRSLFTSIEKAMRTLEKNDIDAALEDVREFIEVGNAQFKKRKTKAVCKDK